MDYKVDYHIHSCYSDGTMTPVELVRKYKDEEYDIIAITDHDGIGAFQEAKIAAEALKIKLISGVELSTVYAFELAADADEAHTAGSTTDLNLHLLGYGFDAEDPALNAKLDELAEYRRERNEELASVLAEMGYPIDPDALMAKSKGGYVGKPDIARAWVKQGLLEKVSDAWKNGKFFDAPEVKAIHKKRIPVTEAMSLLKNAGGTPVLAHPGKIRGLGERGSQNYWTNLQALLLQLKKAGLKGLECYHPNHSETEIYHFVELAGKLHLHITEGSDFHGEE